MEAKDDKYGAASRVLLEYAAFMNLAEDRPELYAAFELAAAALREKGDGMRPWGWAPGTDERCRALTYCLLHEGYTPEQLTDAAAANNVPGAMVKSGFLNFYDFAFTYAKVPGMVHFTGKGRGTILTGECLHVRDRNENCVEIRKNGSEVVTATVNGGLGLGAQVTRGILKGIASHMWHNNGKKVQA